jgi:hypothetical protein
MGEHQPRPLVADGGDQLVVLAKGAGHDAGVLLQQFVQSRAVRTVPAVDVAHVRERLFETTPVGDLEPVDCGHARHSGHPLLGNGVQGAQHADQLARLGGRHCLGEAP